MNKVGGYIFDIDGTLAMMDPKSKTYVALPGAVEALLRIQSIGLGCMAYTNGTFTEPEAYIPKLASIGLNFKSDEIITPASVAALHLASMSYKKVLVIAAEGTRLPVQKAGVNVVVSGEDLSGVDALLVGWMPDFSRKELDAACAVVWAGAEFYATSMAPYFASSTGRMLGISGAIAAMVTNGTGKKATVLGKPSVMGLKMASKVLNVPTSRLVVVGDDPKLEILMARRGGAKAIGVTTGEYNLKAFNDQPSSTRAHEIYTSLQAALDSKLMPRGS